MMFEPLLIAAAGLVFVEFDACDPDAYEAAAGRRIDKVTMSVSKLETFLMTDDSKHEGCIYLYTTNQVLSVRGSVSSVMKRLEFQGFRVIMIEGKKDE